MGIIKSNKTASKQIINGKESFFVTLTLESEPNIRDNPKDIVLMLDKSGSMNGAPLEEMKIGAKHFIDIIDSSTDGVQDEILGGNTKVGLVSFSAKANADLELNNSVPIIKGKIDAINSGGTTNHKEAFIKGVETVNKGINANKVLVMFTDGESNAGDEGFDIADNAKASGIEVFVIGFESRPGKLDINILNRWASEPVADHVLTSPSYLDIDSMFSRLASLISEPKASDIVLTDKINPCFDIVSAGVPKIGKVRIQDKQTLSWSIDSLGATTKETAELVFTVVHNGKCSGVVDVDESYDYTDKEGNTINLPNPTIEIVATTVDVYEDCPIAKDVVADSCEDYVIFDAGDIAIDGLGRVVQVNTTIKDVCPNKRVALAVVLTEVDDSGIEHERGMKTMLVPAHSNAGCIDVKVNCIKFVLPEALDTTGNVKAMCNPRLFKARLFANYVDTDYYCCKD